MIAIAKNLGEAPLFYCERLQENKDDDGRPDGTVSAVMPDGKFASQQPVDPNNPVYGNAYGLFKFVPQNKSWERAELKGAILSYTVNGEKFGYVAF